MSLSTRFLLICSSYLLALSGDLVAHDVVGFWKTVDDKTGTTQSIIGIYEYQGKIYGRIIATYADDGKIQDTMYSPKKRAPGVIGNPFYAGMDIIWDLKLEHTRYAEGKILDPEHGRVYDAEMWRQGNNLVVRGEIFFFGVNQTWPEAKDNDFPHDFVKPNLAQLVPVIPKVK